MKGADTLKRIIFHVDVNSAFLSWTAADRVKKGLPDLRDIPSAIGGDPKSRTGVIVAKSIPAKRYGVKTGEPVSSALRKCPDLVLAKSDFSLYDRESKAFLGICREYSPDVEQFSIDECFIDMSGMEKVYPDLHKTAYEIKDRIKNELGFTVNIGIGNSKLCAKMASDFEKPDKVHTLYDEEIPEKMWPLPAGRLLFVGESTVDKLSKAYITTIGDIASVPLETLQSITGNKAGLQLYNYSRGIDESKVISVPPKAKGYSVETTFEENIKKAEDAHRVLLYLCDSVSFRMRNDEVKAYCISVHIRTDKFKNMSHQKRLSNATDITAEIYENARILFDELWDRVSPLRLIGVSLSDLTDEEFEQISLFENTDESEIDKEKEKKKDKALDELRRRFGSKAVFRASKGNSSRIDRKHTAEFDNRINKK